MTDFVQTSRPRNPDQPSLFLSLLKTTQEGAAAAAPVELEMMLFQRLLIRRVLYKFIGSASAADLQYVDFGLIPIAFDRFSIRMV